jgi:glycerol uptake facilitator-like aquaporin
MVGAEFLGTAILTAVLLGVGKSGVGFSYFLSTGVALAFLATALLLAGVSGAHFNPAVTLGLWSTRKVPTLKALFYIAAQLLGGLAAWGIYNYLTQSKMPSNPLVFSWPVMVAEIIAGGVIVFGVAAAVYQGFSGLQAAATIAGAIFVGTMIASLGSNGIGNPAIALGVHNWSWQYISGPLIGGIVGANLYLYLFAPKEALAAAIARPAKTAKATKAVKPASKKKK